MTIGRCTETHRQDVGQDSLPKLTEEQSNTKELSSSHTLVSTTPILDSVPSASAGNFPQASPLFKMLTTLENPPLAVALDLDLTALTPDLFHTDQFISQMVLNFMRILQQKRKMTYYPATHRGMNAISDFYIEVHKYYQPYATSHSMDLINYRTFQVVENLKNALSQPAAAVSTLDDLVFSKMGEEKAAVLGSGFVKLSLYEKALYKKSTIGEKFELEDFKKNHPGLRVTYLPVYNKNNQLLSIAKHLIDVNKDNLKNNPGMKIELVVLDDQMEILTDALHYERNTRWHREKELRYTQWPDRIKLTILRAVNYPPNKMHRNNDDILNMHLATYGNRHFMPLSPITGKATKSDNPLFFDTYIFQPFFVEVTLNEKEELQYGEIITHDFLKKELQAEVKTQESPTTVANETKTIVDMIPSVEATGRVNEAKKEAVMPYVAAEVQALAPESEVKTPAVGETTRLAAERARVETTIIGNTLERDRFTKRYSFFQKAQEKVLHFMKFGFCRN